MLKWAVGGCAVAYPPYGIKASPQISGGPAASGLDFLPEYFIFKIQQKKLDSTIHWVIPRSESDEKSLCKRFLNVARNDNDIAFLPAPGF